MFILAGRRDGSRNKASAEEAKAGINDGCQPAATAHARKSH